MQGSDDNNKVNESKEYDSKHYFLRSFCYTVSVVAWFTSGGTVFVPVTFFVSLGISNVVLFGLLIIQIASQRNDNTGNWDETLPILQ